MFPLLRMHSLSLRTQTLSRSSSTPYIHACRDYHRIRVRQWTTKSATNLCPSCSGKVIYTRRKYKQSTSIWRIQRYQGCAQYHARNPRLSRCTIRVHRRDRDAALGRYRSISRPFRPRSRRRDWSRPYPWAILSGGKNRNIIRSEVKLENKNFPL